MDTKEPIGCIPEVPVRVNYRKRVRHYLMRNGGTKGAEVSVHPDARVQGLSDRWRNATRGTGMRCHWHHGNFARLFPVLWETAKAADRWTAKNPPEAQYSN